MSESIDAENGVAFGEVHPITIQTRSLGVVVSSKAKADVGAGGKRPILQNISLRIPAGKLMAILVRFRLAGYQLINAQGGSGSGKTTLLNTLAGRPVGNILGEILFNGEDSKRYINSGVVAYVQQQDNLLPYITVRETLRYAARLRLPRSMSLEKKFALVESVILELGLKECADTVVGDDWRKGISGGEKRRVSVGVQLLMNPSLIFLDEPTTGLDSFSARSLIETLVNLAHKSNRTIVMSIHQPRSDIFACFDEIALLCRGGRLAYSGPPAGSVRFLESVGYPLVGEMNGADFIIDTVAIDDHTEESEIVSKERLNKVVNAWDALMNERSDEENGEAGKKDQSVLDLPILLNRRVDGASLFEQVKVLSRRIIVNTWEDRLTLWGSLIEMILMGLVIGAIFFRPNQDPTGMYSRKAALYACCAMQSYLGLMFMIHKLSLELRENRMKVFDRERSDKMYSAAAFMISWVWVNFSLYGALSLIFSVLLYFMIDLRTDDFGYHFGIFILGILYQQWITMAFAFFCIAFARDFATASLIGNSFFTFLSLSSGFFIPETSIPVYIRWFEYISYTTYGLRLFISNEFDGHIFECPSIPVDDTVARLSCDGNNLITATGFDPGVNGPITGLTIILFALLVIACIVLSFFPPPSVKQGRAVGDRKQRKIAADPSVAIDMAVTKPPSIYLTLDKLTVNYEIRHGMMTASSVESKKILQGVTADFPCGELTAILGASGAGKSTLMQLLHARGQNLASNIKVLKSGRILHNGKEFSREEINACTSSVRQDDSHLLPALTARETLVFAAMLRLPNSWPRQRKIERAEEVLYELGLKECANTVVGGEGVKGLSGGEKRRLSVGLAMLMDPAILLLDEPTSGLDASAARNMMLTLKKIAADGRTVICTIHQPRSDIYPLLDRILLLARGGRVVYEGPGHGMVPHLSSLGFHLPPLTNPADFALDLSSVDLRNSSAENSSRVRVDTLVKSWAERSTSVERNNITSDGEDTAALVLKLSSSKRRQPNLIAARVMNEIALGVIFALYFTKLTTDQAGVTSRIGLLQECGAIVFIGMLNCLSVFPQELLLFRFEHQDGTTAVETFFLTYTINEIPFELFGAVVYGLLCTYLMGLHLNPGWIILTGWGYMFAGESIGIGFCTIFSKPGFSVQLMSALISVFNQTQGFMSVTMPKFFQYLNYLSVISYGAKILAMFEFDSSVEFTCSDGTTCQYTNGSDVLSFLDFPNSDRDRMLNVVGLVLSMLLYRLIAYIVMKRALP
ncbi:hypothetical protein HDU83_009129 [Entophlyctis luteolus]|nr:hypothetical protein HDU83_009129 [Entophlyctis luteolus]